jgi:protein tyrosine/serine phosphatase
MARRWRGAAGLVVLVAAGIWVWSDVLRDRLIPKRWGEVEKGGLYRSGQLHRALIKETLDEFDIDLIVSLLGEEPGNTDQKAERAAAGELGIELVEHPLDGSGKGDVREYIGALEDVLQARREGRTVLVHCGAGTYRTGVLVGWYRLLVEGASPEAVRAEMLSYDVDTDDIDGLADYMNDHVAEVAEALRQRGLLDAVREPLPRLPPG